MGCTSWSILSLVALLAALGLFLLYLLAQRLPLRKAGFYGTLVAFLLFVVTTWFAAGERHEILDDTQAVVMTASTAVKSSPDKSSTDLFVLHEGTKVTVTDRLDDWCEVVIADGKRGGSSARKSRSSDPAAAPGGEIQAPGRNGGPGRSWAEGSDSEGVGPEGSDSEGVGPEGSASEGDGPEVRPWKARNWKDWARKDWTRAADVELFRTR